jgi:hypothetical protein
MKRQAVAAKSELAKVNSPFCAASEPRRLELLRPAAVVPALPRIGLPKEFPDRPEQDNDTAEGLQIRIGTTPWRRQRFPGAPAISGLPGFGGPPLADRPYGD